MKTIGIISGVLLLFFWVTRLIGRWIHAGGAWDD